MPTGVFVRKLIPASERFGRFVDRSLGPDGCWPWSGHRNHKGYGKFQMLRRSCGAHRVAYELANGAIPEGLHVLHRCDNPPCVNPAHLWLGTNAENRRDAGRKGRIPVTPALRARQQYRSVCSRGHPRQAIAGQPGKYAECRICRRANWTRNHSRVR